MATSTTLQIDEAIGQDGSLLPVSLHRAGALFELWRGPTLQGKVSEKIIAEVVKRYGRPLEEQPRELGESLSLSSSVVLRSWRYRAPVDLEARLYLLLYLGDHEPLAVLGRQVASALEFLCRTQSA